MNAVHVLKYIYKALQVTTSIGFNTIYYTSLAIQLSWFCCDGFQAEEGAGTGSPSLHWPS